MTPASPELMRGDSLAARALRLIGDGEIDRRGVGGLAQSLGVTARHVLRAVTEATDCGPLDLARAHRVHLARMLLTTTTAPMRDVATAAGFPSVRQFNATMLALYRSTPGAIRFGLRSPIPGYREPGPLVMRCVLPTAAPVSPRLLGEWAARAIPEVEEGTDRWFARTVRLPRGLGQMRIDLDSAGRVLARLTVADGRDMLPLVERTRRLAARAADGAMPAGPPHRRAIGSDTGAMDAAEVLLRGVVTAETSVSQSRTILGGLAAALGEVTPWGRVFPTAAVIARAGREVLRGPTDRVERVIRVAQAIAAGEIDVAAGWSWDYLAERHAAILGR